MAAAGDAEVDAVSVAGGNDGRGHGRIGLEAKSVAHAFAGADALYRDHAAGERHDRRQRDGRCERRRHDAVEHQAGAHQVVPDARVAQRGRAVGGMDQNLSIPVRSGFSRAYLIDCLQRRLEVCTLLVEERLLRLVGRRKVRVDRVEPQVGAREQFRQRAPQVVVAEAEAVHPRVDLQVVAQRRLVLRRGLLHGARGGRRRDGRRQRELEQAVEIADAQRAENQNRRAHAGAPQHDGLFDVRARQQIRPGSLERERDTLRAMSVGVGFDHGDDSRRVAARSLRVRDTAFEEGPYRLEVGL